MKISKRVIIKIFVAVVIISLLFSRELILVNVIANGYYEESLYFDENGNFFMTTHDIVATKSTKYCTLGWTIKRYDLPIEDPLNMCATIAITCDGSVVDPENERYLYSFFYCDKDTIFNAIGAVSAEWQRELYLNGATVYMDGIMTVVKNGVKLGRLNSDGSTSGEVYNTYEGIVTARNWGPNSKNSLLTHFNKSIYFPPVTGYIEPEESEEQYENKHIRLSFGKKGPELDCNVNINSAVYNPTTGAIPSGEQISIDVWQREYAYDVEYRKVSGEIQCKVPITLIAKRTVVGEDGTVTEADLPILETSYTCMMPYSYYEIVSVELYYADGMYINSVVFGKNVYAATRYIPDVEVIMRDGVEEHVKCEDITEPIEIHIGDITDTREIEESINTTLSDVISKPQVRNDYLRIVGDEIMTDDWEETAKAPKQNILYVTNVIASTMVTIPSKTANGEYPVRGTANYGYMVFGDAKASYISESIDGVDSIKIHTPVVCVGSIKNLSLQNPVLSKGDSFLIEVTNEGKHIDAKGYGEGDYKKHVLCNQVKFPFEVSDDKGETICANTWLTVEGESEFILSEKAGSGKYEIEYRTVAINFSEAYSDYETTEKNANLSPEKYIATDFTIVEIEGLTYEFELTEVVKYKEVTDLKETTLPFRGENGLPLGSHFRFLLKLLGEGKGENVVTITPSFLYVSEEELKEVDVYYEDVTSDGRVILKKWNTKEHKIELTETAYQAEDAIYRQWEGTYVLPMKSYFLLKDNLLPTYGVDRSHFLRNGYIVVLFDIKIKNENGDQINIDCWGEPGKTAGEVVTYNIGKSVKDSMRITGTH